MKYYIPKPKMYIPVYYPAERYAFPTDNRLRLAGNGSTSEDAIAVLKNTFSFLMVMKKYLPRKQIAALYSSPQDVLNEAESQFENGFGEIADNAALSWADRDWGTLLQSVDPFLGAGDFNAFKSGNTTVDWSGGTNFTDDIRQTTVPLDVLESSIYDPNGLQIEDFGPTDYSGFWLDALDGMDELVAFDQNGTQIENPSNYELAMGSDLSQLTVEQRFYKVLEILEDFRRLSLGWARIGIHKLASDTVKQTGFTEWIDSPLAQQSGALDLSLVASFLKMERSFWDRYIPMVTGSNSVGLPSDPDLSKLPQFGQILNAALDDGDRTDRDDFKTVYIEDYADIFAPEDDAFVSDFAAVDANVVGATVGDSHSALLAELEVALAKAQSYYNYRNTILARLKIYNIQTQIEYENLNLRTQELNALISEFENNPDFKDTDDKLTQLGIDYINNNILSKFQEIEEIFNRIDLNQRDGSVVDGIKSELSGSIFDALGGNFGVNPSNFSAIPWANYFFNRLAGVSEDSSYAYLSEVVKANVVSACEKRAAEKDKKRYKKDKEDQFYEKLEEKRQEAQMFNDKLGRLRAEESKAVARLISKREGENRSDKNRAEARMSSKKRRR